MKVMRSDAESVPSGLSNAVSGAWAVAQVIAAQEGPIVYGLAGGYMMRVLDALYSVRDRVEVHLVPQESLATVMAEAQGRLTGRPAFVVAQGAWVLGNAGIGIMEARLGGGGGGMGYAVPAARAAAITFPGRPAVAVCEDGGVSMSLHALLTAVEPNLTLTVVVLDNGLLGWAYNWQGDRPIATELKRFDYAAIAGAMGCHAKVIESLQQFAGAIHAARMCQGGSVIVAKTSNIDRHQDVRAAIEFQDVYSFVSKSQHDDARR